MATATAMQLRPLIFTRAIAKVELVSALAEDLKEYAGYDENKNPIYKLRVGLIYWLKSLKTGQIESTPRILTANCNKTDLKNWLDLKMIWVAKEPFN